MIRWPWVSRRAYDLAVEVGNTRLADARAEIERVRADAEDVRKHNLTLVEHITRLARAEHGLSETPRPPRAPIEPMPQSLKDHIDGFANPGIRRALTVGAERRRIRGEPWAKIERDIRAEDEPKEPVVNES